MKKTIFAFMVLFLASCGKEKSASGTPKMHTNREPQVEKPVEATGEGQFLAVLNPLNETVSGRVSGAATFSIDKDEFVGDVRFSGGALTASSLHAQGLREGHRCPTLEDDKNQDGFIDAREGEQVYGKTLIPLDGDLNAQHLEYGTWPFSDEFGGYIYAEVASFEKLLNDLKEADINPADSLIKLSNTQDLELSGNVVVIEGVSSGANLPETVNANSRFDRHQTFPVACGVLRRVSSRPGTIDRDLPRTPYERKPGGIAGEDDGTIIVPPDIEGPIREGHATNYGDGGN